jgi:hypothetical protein
VGHSSTSEKVRRLSLQNGKAGHGKPGATLTIEHVRSFIAFPFAADHVSTLESFRVLRVLDLEGCDLSHGYSLKYLGNLHHLRYLGLRETCIDQIPEEIGNLQFLQTFDVQENDISSLPLTVVRLTQLMCLRIDQYTRVPKWMGRLTALEELSVLGIHDDSLDIVEELGHLTELRVLRIFSFTAWNNCLDKSLVESLNKLQKIQSLEICIDSGECNLDGWSIVAPRHICSLELLDSCRFSVLPAWVKVDPLLLVDLSLLCINVRGLQQEDLEILGRLPALYCLVCIVCQKDLRSQGRFTIGACSFPCMVRCLLRGLGGPLVFQHGAMPRLARISFDFPVQGMREINGGFDLGLGNLPLLQRLEVFLRSGGTSKEEVEEAEAAVRHAVDVHPNHPNLFIDEVNYF